MGAGDEQHVQLRGDEGVGEARRRAGKVWREGAGFELVELFVQSLYQLVVLVSSVFFSNIAMPLNRPPHCSITAVSVAEGVRPLRDPAAVRDRVGAVRKAIWRPAGHGAAVRVDVPRRLLRLRRRAQCVGCAGELHRHGRILRERAIALGAPSLPALVRSTPCADILAVMRRTRARVEAASSRGASAGLIRELYALCTECSVPDVSKVGTRRAAIEILARATTSRSNAHADESAVRRRAGLLVSQIIPA